MKISEIYKSMDSAVLQGIYDPKIDRLFFNKTKKKQNPKPTSEPIHLYDIGNDELEKEFKRLNPNLSKNTKYINQRLANYLKKKQEEDQ